VTTAGPWRAEAGPGEVILWDLMSRKARARFALDDRVYGAAFSPDSATVVAACWGGGVNLWAVPRDEAEAALAEGCQFVQASAPVEGEPPAKEYAEDYHAELANDGKLGPRLRLFGPDAAQCMRFEPASLRFVLPAGFPREGPLTGIATDFGVRGD